MIRSFRYIFTIVLGTVLLAQCARPVSPTGGPRDEQGPSVVKTVPETGTTNFEGRTVELHFSEFVNRSSLENALVMEPDIGITYDLDWGRRSVKVEFDDQLPEETTIILSVGTEFQDMNGNNISSPVKIAVSTGPEIDEGKIKGRVLDARTGKGAAGRRVLLYRDSLKVGQKADYSAQTDTSGIFNFSYLRQGRYRAIWVEDRNRNKVWDQQVERAQPFRQKFVELEKGGVDSLGTLFIADADTSKPKLQGVGLFSSRRMRLRFSENISVGPEFGLQVLDSLSQPFSTAYPLYISPNNRFVLFAQSSNALQPDDNYRLLVQNVEDPSGNVRPADTLGFEGSAQKDTTRQRIIHRTQQLGIFPGQPLQLVYARPIVNSRIRDSVKVVQGQTMNSGWRFVEVDRNTLSVKPDGQWKEGVDYEIRVWDPLAADYHAYQPTIWHDRQLGSIALNPPEQPERPDSTYRAMIYQDELGVMADTTFSGTIEIDGLPPVTYRTTVFQDLNGNGVWDAGTVIPYRTPEPLFVRPGLTVRKRLTSDLTIIFD